MGLKSQGLPFFLDQMPFRKCVISNPDRLGGFPGTLSVILTHLGLGSPPPGAKILALQAPPAKPGQADVITRTPTATTSASSGQSFQVTKNSTSSRSRPRKRHGTCLPPPVSSLLPPQACEVFSPMSTVGSVDRETQVVRRKPSRTFD